MPITEKILYCVCYISIYLDQFDHKRRNMQEESDPQLTLPRAEKPEFLTQTKFEDFNLSEKILDGLNESGFEHCTPIQAQVLPVSLTGRDVAGQAQTGTGKTAAFLVTVFSRILGMEKRKNGMPAALIVAPTRELALQIYEDAAVLARHTGLTLAQVVGGIDYRKQAEILKKGVDIVICTPGRIIDYLKQGIFKTADISIVVVDEADRLFDLGFTKDMRYILRKLPHYEKRQSMLFSATLSYRILALTYDYMNLPEFISVTPENVSVDGIDQTLFHVGSREKLPLLLGLLKREDWSRLLIFHNTKAGVEHLAERLSANGFPAEGITGDLPQPQRLKLMERFKGGKTKILVATDVASRGIHVEDISHVINYELPQDAENYTHRIGRTARAGKTGRAISFACEDCVFYLEPIEKMLGDKIPVVWPDDDWFLEDKGGPIPGRYRERKKSPTRVKGRVPERKRPQQSRNPRKIRTSSQPGGVFGLVPETRNTQGDGKDSDSGEIKKKKKGKPWRKKKKPALKDTSVKTDKEQTVQSAA